MKRALLTLAIVLPIGAMAQYRGGADDGTSRTTVLSQNPFASIYKGGANDGHSLGGAVNQNPLSPIYSGGSNDGVSLTSSTNQNALPEVYKGGSNDGVSAFAIVNQNPLSSIYTGGSNDGVSAVLSVAQNVLPDIYHGGLNDGVANAVALANNALPNVYKGGANDGASITLSLNQNPTNPPVVLSVSLVSFEGNWFNDDAVLAWQTNEEKGLDHFELERSGDAGKTFSMIARVAPGTEAGDLHDYRYTDVRAHYLPDDFLLYRLKSVDKEGSYKTSGVVKLSKDKTVPAMVVYPNPNGGHFTLALMNMPDITGYGYILSASDGRVIERGDIGQPLHSFDLSRQGAATYHLVIYKNGQSVQQFSILVIQ